jgi:NAD(P)-dependent dehydrogenase (short-subunit alcohol dehydrogenase family)
MALRGLDGKVAVITGAAGELGSATARRLASEGCRLVLSDLDRDAIPALEGAVTLSADVTTVEGVDAYVKAATDAFGRIDIFHNNAGVEGKVAPIVDSDPANFDHVIAVNVRGVYLGLRAVMKVMIANGGGTVVNMSSVAGLQATAGIVAYGASKQAVISMTKTAAAEGGPGGVRVNAVCPGTIASPMLSRLEEGMAPGNADLVRQGMVMRVPQGRYGTPDEVADVVTWLLSDEASYVNGSVVSIDGGMAVH